MKNTLNNKLQLILLSGFSLLGVFFIALPHAKATTDFDQTDFTGAESLVNPTAYTNGKYFQATTTTITGHAQPIITLEMWGYQSTLPSSCTTKGVVDAEVELDVWNAGGVSQGIFYTPLPKTMYGFAWWLDSLNKTFNDITSWKFNIRIIPNRAEMALLSVPDQTACGLDFLNGTPRGYVRYSSTATSSWISNIKYHDFGGGGEQTESNIFTLTWNTLPLPQLTITTPENNATISPNSILNVSGGCPSVGTDKLAFVKNISSPTQLFNISATFDIECQSGNIYNVSVPINTGDYNIYILDYGTQTYASVSIIVSTSGIEIPTTSCGTTGFAINSDTLHIHIDFGKGICDIVRFLFVPHDSTLQDFADINTSLSAKAPFNYFYTAKSLVENISTSSTSTITSVLTLHLPTTTPIHFDIDMFSANTINKYTDSTSRTAIRTAVEFALSGLFLTMVIYEGRKLFKKH